MFGRIVMRAAFACVAITYISCATEIANAQQFVDRAFRSYPLKSTVPTAIEESLRRFLSDRLTAGEPIELVSDNRENRLLVRGSAEVQQLAGQFIQAIDLPDAIPNVTQGVTTVRGYRSSSMEEMQQKLAGLRSRFAQQGTVRIAADERTLQLVINAPESVHREIVANWNNPAYYQSNAPAGAGQGNGASRPTRQQLQLENITWQQLLTGLRGVQGPNAAVTSPNNGTLEVNVPSHSGNSTQLLIDQNNQVVQISGTEGETQQWKRVVQALDSQPADTNELSVTGRLGDAQPATITRTITMLGAGGVGNQWVRPLTQRPQQLAGQPQAQQPRQEPLQLAQANAQPQQGGVVEQQGGGEVARMLMQGDSSGSFLGPVAIEFIEGTDIFIVRGQKRDVDRVMQIIKDIEQMTEDTEPTVDVYQLEHANSQAVATLVNELNENVLQARQGDVSVTPLIKPNSVLLIGREQGVESVKKIIEKLDVEAESSDQFKVFKLKFLSSVDAELTINNLYNQTQTGTTEETTGLGPRVQAVADFRSNSIVVQASPRDLQEIQELLDEIDIEGSAMVAEVQVFKLKNAIAEEVAEVLNDTLGTNQSAQNQSNVGQQGQGANGVTQARSSRQAMQLVMRVLDAEGKKLLDDEILESGILSNVVVTSNERANSVVVTAPKGSMELIAEIVRQLDELPAQEAEIRVFSIVNGDASLLIEMLDTLFAQDENEDGPLIQSAAGTGESTLVPLRFALDQRTNSIIASGNAADLRVVEAILLKLDSSDVSRRKTRVVELQIQEAQFVADAITQFVQERRAAILSIAQDTTSQYDLLDQEVVVVAEAQSNKLIVNATDRYFDDILEVIRELDRRPDMVMVQVLIAEVDLNSTEEMGVELGIQDSLLFNRSDAGVPGFNFNNQALGNNATNPGSARDQVAGQALADLGLGRQNGELGFGGLVLSASNESVSVLVRALQEARRLDVISRPQVMMLNNTTGEVQVGAQVPFLLGSTNNGFNITNTVEFVPVGLILQVTPRISPDGLVVLDVVAEKSDLGSVDDGIPIQITDGQVIRAPQINATRAQTIVTARDGQTVILGGLITKERNAFERKVPYLADIPFFGRLFRTDGVAEQRTELLVILTPHIVRDEADIDRINSEEYARMSWCLGNVIETHGDIGPYASYEEGVIYSDSQNGIMDGGSMDAGAMESGTYLDGSTYGTPVEGVIEPQAIPSAAPLPSQMNATPLEAFPPPTSSTPPVPLVPSIPQAKKSTPKSVLLNSPRNASLFPRSAKSVWKPEERPVATASKQKASKSTFRRVKYDEPDQREQRDVQLISAESVSSPNSNRAAVFRFDEVPGE